MGHHFFLTELLLKSCTGLESLPSSVVELRCLEKLDLEGCSKLKELSNVPCNLRDLILKGTAIQEVPSSIGHCSQLVTLDLRSCIKLESVPSSIGELKFLETLFLSGCSKLKRLPDEVCNLKAVLYFSIEKCRNLNELPEDLGNLESLSGLWAFNSGLKKVPPSINFLRRLVHLDCNSCTGLMLPPLTGLVRLRHLYSGSCGMTEIFTCTGSLVLLKRLNLSANLLEKLPTSINSLVSLKELYLGGNLLKELPTSIGFLVSLETLYLSGNLLETLPTSVEQLSKLSYLDMMNCKRLKCLPKLPSSLGSLNVEGCTSLESMAAAWHTKGNVYNCISYVNASDCVNLDVNICRNIIEEMLVRIEYLSRQPKFEDFHKELRFIRGLCIPGDEIPQGIKYRNNNGSFLQCPLRSDPLDFMVLIFCVVLSPNQQYGCGDLTYLECEYYLESNCGQLFHSHPTYWRYGLRLNQSAKHVFLWHSTIGISSNYFWNKASFKFNVKGERGLSPSSVVIKCGVHLSYHDIDIDSPSRKIKDRNPNMCYSKGIKMSYGSTEEEARASCHRCQGIFKRKK